MNDNPLDDWERTTTITLNEYQRANLLALIEACGYGNTKPANHLRGLDTGDWIGEVYIKLGGFTDPPTFPPNQTAERMAADARRDAAWLRDKRLQPILDAWDAIHPYPYAHGLIFYLHPDLAAALDAALKENT